MILCDKCKEEIDEYNFTSYKVQLMDNEDHDVKYGKSAIHLCSDCEKKMAQDLMKWVYNYFSENPNNAPGK